jgi:DNA (cytosine-5)-methyltransferase 1
MDAQPLRYLSVCSGIEAATVAWHPLGFEAVGFSEIDPFARAVLAHHYPDVPLFGDFTTLTELDYGAIDLLVGGTPCQSFSIAGLRRGLADDRGNRRRVFVVGYLGDWRPAAAVLFERESLQRDITPRCETRQNTAGALGARTCRSIGAQDAECGHLIAKTLMGCGAKHDAELETYVLDKQKQWPADVACTLNAQYGDKMGLEDQHALAGAPLFVPARAYNVTYCDANGRRKDRPNGGMYVTETDQSKTITAGGDRSTYIAFEPGSITRNVGPRGLRQTCSTLRTQMGDNQQAVLTDMAVRRLTPRECERLQGFPDDYTLIPYRGKPAADGPRYKALGNSMAVPVMRWLGERIKKVDALLTR